MPLRCFQKLEVFGAGEIFYEVSQIDEQSGYTRKVRVSQNIALPDKKKTDLFLMLKNGINLQQVKCNLLDPVQVVADKVDSVESVTDKQGDDDYAE